MKKIRSVLVTVIICTTVASCLKLKTYGCEDDWDAPYTPVRYANSIKWDEFNSLIHVQEYFRSHDSTIKRHDGDTLLLYGYSTTEKPMMSNVGGPAFSLMCSRTGELIYCCSPLQIRLGDDTVEEWMIQPLRKIYVEGTIAYGESHGMSSELFWIDAIKIDSLKF